MRKSILIAACLLTTLSLGAQVRTPRPSPKATLTQAVGTTDITITYSRPGVKGRTIWGDLVPYDKVWRAGANEATTIQFSDDVTIEGQKLAKGTYSFHATPGKDQWTLHFNTVVDQWGSYSYDVAKDALAVKVKPQAAPHAEWMTFEVPELTTDTAKIMLHWEKVAVPFTVNTDTTAKTLTQFKNALKPDWRTPYQAADFAFQNNAASAAEINAWLDQSLKVNENLANLWLKAQIQKKAGDTAGAIKTAELAVSKASPQQKDFANFVQGNIDSWKK